MIGPQTKVCDGLHAEKYRQPNETFEQSANRLAAVLSDDEQHRQRLKSILGHMRFMPAGRIQGAIGSPRVATAGNCFVSGTIEDSMDSIFEKLAEAAETMRHGGGIGFDFSNLRPLGDRIVSLDSTSSGPVSFMGVFDAMCKTIRSAGHRRGAMMGVLRVDHPDIELFIRAKQKDGALENFNISVAITDKFMKAVFNNTTFKLKFKGRVYKEVSAVDLWDEIMRANWEWAEPGVLFIDNINYYNNLYYCEDISATNPCGEQPLPPYGACILGSFNLAKYTLVDWDYNFSFDFDLMKSDIKDVVRAMDNVIDIAKFPLEKQKDSALSTRRMGLGITGLGTTLNILGIRYGSKESTEFVDEVMRALTTSAYLESIELAKEKGAFPSFSRDKYLNSEFLKGIGEDILNGIREHGIRNSHLISIAPTGTISFCADNISSGIEPVFATTVERVINTEDGAKKITISDYAKTMHNITGNTVQDLSVQDHINIMVAVAPWVDSAMSKTINVGDKITFNEFKKIYMRVYLEGIKGCTTFRPAGKRFGIINAIEDDTEGGACFVDPSTGVKECS